MEKLQLNIKKTLLKRKVNGVVTKKATADNTDEEDETNTPQNPNNPDGGMLG